MRSKHFQEAGTNHHKSEDRDENRAETTCLGFLLARCGIGGDLASDIFVKTGGSLAQTGTGITARHSVAGDGVTTSRSGW